MILKLDQIKKKGGLGLNCIILDQSGNEHLKAKDVTLTNTLFKLESLTNNISWYSIIEDVPYLVYESVRKLPYHHINLFLNPHMNPNFLAKYNILWVIICLIIIYPN